ncbi:hypothetical protein DSM106972_099400 [Dulcicalothrix desertica PCC 7102]|uniref:Uncharacterized protein n=1 Tax=Dulcicalothrix desertica PCC 7102 TaxID=232991 RepID=A0A3S1A2U3_9CYAN|nr:hypothetical protein [Dulcicalothrix desertica]RUS92366.1 hypothetical protein DSM106972_099400 [Dulcicalothrix desertica PCC 7102]TWH62831.1 hypothetical protein CAL7102_00364 [Dulcicalothrix desertica PCC 7102]
MTKRNNVYRGYPIKKFGRGKKVIFQAIINEVEWSTMIESDLKKAIDAWIDEGKEPPTRARKLCNQQS